MTCTGAPNVTGLNPSADQTYQPVNEPRSSLPGRPAGVGVNGSCTERITACDFHGWPTQL